MKYGLIKVVNFTTLILKNDCKTITYKCTLCITKGNLLLLKDLLELENDHVRISKYKNISAKGYTPNWSEEVFIISKIKNTVPWTYIISDLNNEEIIGSFL